MYNEMFLGVPNLLFSNDIGPIVLMIIEFNLRIPIYCEKISRQKYKEIVDERKSSQLFHILFR